MENQELIKEHKLMHLRSSNFMLKSMIALKDTDNALIKYSDDESVESDNYHKII